MTGKEEKCGCVQCAKDGLEAGYDEVMRWISKDDAVDQEKRSSVAEIVRGQDPALLLILTAEVLSYLIRKVDAEIEKRQAASEVKSVGVLN